MIQIIENPERNSWNDLTIRNVLDDETISARVADIVEQVRKGGDEALLRLIKEIDGLENPRLQVSKEEIDLSVEKISPELKRAINIAAKNIKSFHAAQLSTGVDIETMPGVRCLQRSVPIQRVGLYIPGGTAPLFSTVLMLALPAQVAGCKEIVICTPPSRAGKVADEILYAASVCKVSAVFATGGAQAIAAMTYGTQTIPKVDKIFGPGNRYVTKAKQLVSVHTAIDMPAGPSEVMVLADESANADFIAADILSQAEHGNDSQAILVVNSPEPANKVLAQLTKQLEKLPRKEFAYKALLNSKIIVMNERDTMIDFANAYAAEHLIICMHDAWNIVSQITAAGSIFIGNWSPESAGDYASGTNHTLPTSGWAKACSGVNLDSFMKKITCQELTPQGLINLSDTIIAMAEAEGLDAHANAVKIRLNSIMT
jgi:histidinol dehydrogenase